MEHSPNQQGSKAPYVRETVTETEQKTKYWKYQQKVRQILCSKTKSKNMYL